MAKSSNYLAAVDAHERLSRIRDVSENDPRYVQANTEAQQAYDRLTRAEKVRFDIWR